MDVRKVHEHFRGLAEYPGKLTQGNSGGGSSTTKYTEADLNAMTVAQIKSLADELGYSITATTKADIITEFLTAQG